MAYPDAHALPEVPYLGLFDLYAHFGLVRVMEPSTEELMQERALHELVCDDYDSPHARPWFVSMHASEVPGDDDACERYLAYRMMNFPAAEPMPPWVTTTGTVGKAGELDIAQAWFHGGRLLAIPEDPAQPEIHQLGFVDREHWMTASTDLPILPRGWRRVHIVEVKCKADDVVEEMLNGRLVMQADGSTKMVGRGPDRKHVLQLKATLALAHDHDWGRVSVCSACWFVLWSELFERLGIPGGRHPLSDARGWCPRCEAHVDAIKFELEPPTSGEIYYWSRSWPRKTKSFYYEYEPGFIARARQVMARVRDHYIADTIPARPESFQWGLSPCRDCRFRAICRLDSGLAPRQRKPRPELVRQKLTESFGVEHARSMRPHYDPSAVRARVFQEWS